MQRQLIQIIANQVFHAEIEILDYDERLILKEAQQQTVFPLVFSYLKTAKPYIAEKDRLWNYTLIISKHYSTAIRNLHDHNVLHSILSEANIPYVILKGQASAKYYPDPILRTMGDVDFLVHQTDCNKVDELLSEAGFIRNDESEKHPFHWAYHKGNSTFEMHWQLPGLPEDTKIIDKYTNTIIDDATLCDDQNRTFLVPSEFHHGLVILLHMLSHMTSTGIGLRHLLDWLVFVNHFPDNEFRLLFETPLKEIGLWKFAQVITQIGVLYFGCEKHLWCAEIGEELCSGILEDIFGSGNFGNKDASRKLQAKLMRNSKSRKIEEGSVLRNLITNVNVKARKDFPISVRFPILLPIGWSAVGVEYVKWAIQYNKVEIDHSTIMDAKRRQKMYSQLKLFEKS